MPTRLQGHWLQGHWLQGHCVLWCIYLFTSLVLFDATATLGAETAGPFVAGYERFGRHQEIDLQSSGQLLVRELSCVACHASADVALTPKGGPLLTSAGIMLHADWVASFLMAPHATKPGTTMPDVLGQHKPDERATMVAALTAYIMSQRNPLPEIKASGLVPVPHEFWARGSVSTGQSLYHNVGCVACHEIKQPLEGTATNSPIDALLDELEPEELAKLGLTGAARSVGSVPLPAVKDKYTQLGLTMFLHDPLRHRPAGRMPSFKLAPVEAADLAAYLQSDKGSALTGSPQHSNRRDDAALIADGKRLFRELGCANCHAGQESQPKLQSKSTKAFAALDLGKSGGCLAVGTRPADYQMTEDQQAAIRSLLGPTRSGTVAASTNQQLQQHLLSSNCYACHQRGGLGGVGRFRRDHFETVGKIDLGDEGRLPPPLDQVGRKLQPNWLKNVLAGKKADIRPYLQIRMPVFGTELQSKLPNLLIAADQADPLSQVAPLAAGDATVGRELMDVGCVQCHAFGGNVLPGVVGIDLQGLESRLQPAWFQEFVRDPAALKPRTRMPSFFPDGKSQRPDLLHGDVGQQIAAMWAYLKSSNPALPTKILEAKARSFELKPTSRPIVLRTFMNRVGTHAIAVGFPESVHYAFDAQRMRPVLGWRGRFIDAQGTWFVRLAPPADPLGEAVIKFPEAPILADLLDGQSSPSDGEPRFQGYRLDALGVPILLYRSPQVKVEDRISSHALQGLRREVTFVPVDNQATVNLQLLAHAGSGLKRNGRNSYVNQDQLTVKLIKLGNQAAADQRDFGELRRQAAGTQWQLPLRVAGPTTVELHYQW